LVLASALLLHACRSPASERLNFIDGATEVEVTFHGELSDAELFGRDGSLLQQVRPIAESGRRQGNVVAATPGWLHFEYAVDGVRREVLVAKQPVMNQVSWDDIARAGAAFGDDSTAAVGQRVAIQNARAKGTDGGAWHVRLPTCGRSTLGNLSEWNLLIGAVHRGDMDFTGERYGWVAKPYADEDLKVGYHGSLTWCQEDMKSERVARGYFFVSRFHLAAPDTRTSRLHWRPVLERVVDGGTAGAAAPTAGQDGPTIQWSPSRRVGFAGIATSEELFGPGVGISQLVEVRAGEDVGDGRPDWLRFVSEGKTLLIAARPVKHSLSWNAIAAAGAATGHGNTLRVDGRATLQDAEVTDRQGRRYRVRLLGCGHSTLDYRSEWNSLIGAVHRGDGDFLAYPRGPYGWASAPFDDGALGIGAQLGGSTWCRDTITIDGSPHGVNRGYVTISRFHATSTEFDGDGFGWRPVLELIR
jgi:hypothetical protein